MILGNVLSAGLGQNVARQVQINDGLSIQPDFQYIFQPGGDVAGQKDAAVVGARTSISF